MAELNFLESDLFKRSQGAPLDNPRVSADSPSLSKREEQAAATQATGGTISKDEFFDNITRGVRDTGKPEKAIVRELMQWYNSQGVKIEGYTDNVKETQKQEIVTPNTTSQENAKKTWLEKRIDPEVLGAKDIVEYGKGVGLDILNGAKTYFSDIDKLAQGDVEGTQGFAGDIIKTFEGRVESVQKLNDAIDANGGGAADKVVGAGLHILGGVVDVAGTGVMSLVETLAPESVEDFTAETIENIGESGFGKGVADFVRAGGEKWEIFKESSPVNKELGLKLEAVLSVPEALGGVLGVKGLKQAGKSIIDETSDLGKQAGEFTQGVTQVVDDALITTKAQMDDFFSNKTEGQKLQAEIDAIRNMGKKEVEPSFRNQAAETLIVKNNKMNPVDKEKFLQISGGVTYEKWLNQRGIRGSAEDNIDVLGEKFLNEFEALNNVFASLPRMDVPKSLLPILEEVVDFAKTTENSANISYLQGIQSSIDKTGKINAKDIRKIKQIYEKENKFSYINDSDSVKVRTATNRDSDLRTELESIASNFGLDLKDVSKELQQTRAILDGLSKPINRGTTGNQFDISDQLLASASVVNPSLLLGIAGKNFATSATAKSFLARMLGTEEINIPTIKSPRINQKIKEFEAKEKELKKELKKKKKAEDKQKIQDEIDSIQDEIETIVFPVSQIKE